MGRKSNKVKASKSDKVHNLEITQTFDDSLLPDSHELSQLKEIDPTIIPWIMKRAEKEQEFRHDVVRNREATIERVTKSELSINNKGLWMSFFLILISMSFSFYLILNGHKLIGSIFGGTAILVVAAIFMSKVKSNNEERTTSRNKR